MYTCCLNDLTLMIPPYRLILLFVGLDKKFLELLILPNVILWTNGHYCLIDYVLIKRTVFIDILTCFIYFIGKILQHAVRYVLSPMTYFF